MKPPGDAWSRGGNSMNPSVPASDGESAEPMGARGKEERTLMAVVKDATTSRIRHKPFIER